MHNISVVVVISEKGFMTITFVGLKDTNTLVPSCVVYIFCIISGGWYPLGIS